MCGQAHRSQVSAAGCSVSRTRSHGLDTAAFSAPGKGRTGATRDTYLACVDTALQIVSGRFNASNNSGPAASGDFDKLFIPKQRDSALNRTDGHAIGDGQVANSRQLVTRAEGSVSDIRA